MAISRRRQPPKTEEQPKFQCRDCGHSYDWHEIGANGETVHVPLPVLHGRQVLSLSFSPSVRTLHQTGGKQWQG